MRFGVDPNFGVEQEPAERDRTERRGVEAHRQSTMIAQDREEVLVVEARGDRARVDSVRDCVD